jgi:hypothetical protein
VAALWQFPVLEWQAEGIVKISIYSHGGFVRTIQTFILRLFVDTAEPEALRGALQPIPEAAAIPFAGEEALLALLHELIWHMMRVSSNETGENEPIVSSQ